MKSFKISIVSLAFLTVLFTPAFAGEPPTSSDTSIVDLEELERRMEKTDSIMSAFQETQEAAQKKREQEISEEFAEQSIRNTEQFVNQQYAQKKKDKRRLVFRGVALGIALIAFIISRVRRRKESEA